MNSEQHIDLGTMKEVRAATNLGRDSIIVLVHTGEIDGYKLMGGLGDWRFDMGTVHAHIRRSKIRPVSQDVRKSQRAADAAWREGRRAARREGAT